MARTVDVRDGIHDDEGLEGSSWKHWLATLVTVELWASQGLAGDLWLTAHLLNDDHLSVFDIGESSSSAAA